MGDSCLPRGAKRQWEELVAELDGREGLVPGTGASSVAVAVGVARSIPVTYAGGR